MKTIVIALIMSLSMQSFSCSMDGKGGFAPPNNEYIPEDNGLSFAPTTMEENDFNNVLDKVENTYAPIMQKMGLDLNIIRKWDDGTVNAVAYPANGKANVEMYGGLARHKEATTDALALVACHEIGHHIGGVPKVRTLIFFKQWAANEGQADYFGSLKCFRRVFENEDNFAAIQGLDVPATLQKKCAASFKASNEYSLCVRNGLAGQALAKLLASLRKSTIPSFDTPNKSTTWIFTNHGHPEAQCRLDTYLAGATCTQSAHTDVSQTSITPGTCQGQPVGGRPSCWFAKADSIFGAGILDPNGNIIEE